MAFFQTYSPNISSRFRNIPITAPLNLFSALFIAIRNKLMRSHFFCSVPTNVEMIFASEMLSELALKPSVSIILTVMFSLV